MVGLCVHGGMMRGFGVFAVGVGRELFVWFPDA